MQENLANIKKYLEERKKQIEDRLASLKQEDPFSDEGRLADNAASDTEAREEVGHERIEALRDEFSGQLERVKHALSKLDTGKYGVCDNCGKEIESERLKVFPMAEYCLACEKLMESKKN